VVEDIVSPLFLPSLDILTSDIGSHVHVTAIATSTAGSICVLYAIHDGTSSRTLSIVLRERSYVKPLSDLISIGIAFQSARL
jgi:hypothetical protein